jgi:hypothetical protein
MFLNPTILQDGNDALRSLTTATKTGAKPDNNISSFKEAGRDDQNKKKVGWFSWFGSQVIPILH